MIVNRLRLDHNQMYWQSIVKYNWGVVCGIQVGAVMIGVDYVYFQLFNNHYSNWLGKPLLLTMWLKINT